jgi:hypothetical protein
MPGVELACEPKFIDGGAPDCVLEPEQAEISKAAAAVTAKADSAAGFGGRRRSMTMQTSLIDGEPADAERSPRNRLAGYTPAWTVGVAVSSNGQ